MSKRANISTANGASNSKVRREEFEIQDKESLGEIKKSRLKENNTIDSDDEEQKETETFLNEDDVEGAEDSDVGDELNEFNEDKVEMTPFNLKEEMSSGKFDSNGFYINNKEEDITDNWMEDVDWAEVKKNEKKNKKFMKETEDEDVESVDVDEIKVLGEILKLMHPKETVQKAMQRLGKKKKNEKKRKWKSDNKYGSDDEDDEKDKETSEEKKSKEDFTNLSEFVDQMTATGYYDIYTDTYEKLKFKIKTLEEEDDEDMFADDFDVKKTQNKSKETSETSEIKWEYKWSKNEETVYGPFPTKQMMEWKSSGMFAGEVVCRKISGSSEFYTVARVDFDLYLDE